MLELATHYGFLFIEVVIEVFLLLGNPLIIELG